MRRLAALFTLLLIFGLYDFTGAGNRELSQPYTLTAGDWLAYRLSEFIRTYSDKLSAPTMLSYDQKRGVILVEIFGGCKSVEEAKEDLLKWCDFIREIYIPYAKKSYGLALSMSDYIVVYYNREASGWPEMIRMEGGRLLLPQK